MTLVKVCEGGQYEQEGKHMTAEGPQSLHNGVLSPWQAFTLGWLQLSGNQETQLSSACTLPGFRPPRPHLPPPGSALTVPYTWHLSPFGLL